MSHCEICGKPQQDDLFSAVTGERVCSICKLKYIGGLPTTSERISQARARLHLVDGQFLVQNHGEEARKILGA
jgi:recombinational DNA repair protein (RecF pathway)